MTFMHAVFWSELLSMVAHATAFPDFAKQAPWHVDVIPSPLEGVHAEWGKLRADLFSAAATRVTP